MASDGVNHKTTGAPVSNVPWSIVLIEEAAIIVFPPP